MRRSFLKIGDKSSAGGTIIEGVPHTTHHGVELTFVGAEVSCPACKSLGTIMAKGPRWPGSMMGRQPALEGDICVCKCSPPPVMIASQSDMFETYDGGALASMGFVSGGSYAADAVLLEQAGKTHDQHFRIVNIDGAPIEGLPYRLESADGKVVRGTTASNGLTDIISAHAAHEGRFLLHVPGRQ